MTLLYKGSLPRELQELQTAGRGTHQRTSLFHPGYRTATPCSSFEQREIKIRNSANNQVDQKILRSDIHTTAQLLLREARTS